MAAIAWRKLERYGQQEAAIGNIRIRVQPRTSSRSLHIAIARDNDNGTVDTIHYQPDYSSKNLRECKALALTIARDKGVIK